ncbi:MAG: class I SAM-dependent methyltransferase [Chthoniobacterales bacterium]
MSFKDHFSGHASDYARYRPHYPTEMFAQLASLAPARQLAWDCATGNGQAAVALAPYFARVIATDASGQQIENAAPNERIEYRVAPAESSGLEAGTIDLINVAQALHWFDISAFFAEAERVLKPDGVLAVSAYNLLTVAPEIDAVVNRFYFETTGPYWPPERELVEAGYQTIAFPFRELELPRFHMQTGWNLGHLLGYLRTWSATKKFTAGNGYDPVDSLGQELRRLWGDEHQLREVRWPMTLRVFRKP